MQRFSTKKQLIEAFVKRHAPKPMTIQEALEFELRWAREHRDDVAEQIKPQPAELATEDELEDAWR